MIETEIEKTALWLDIEPILKDKSVRAIYDCQGMVHTEKEDFAIIKINSIDVVRDYIKSIGEYIHIEFTIGLGDYITRLYPYRDNLEFSTKVIKLKNTDGQKDINSDIIITRYKGIFLVNDNRAVSATELQQYDTESLNKADFVSVKLQLMDRSLEPLRIKTVSGVYRHVSQKTLIQSLLAGESDKVLIDGKPSIDGVDVAEPDNQRINQHMMVKDGTLLTELPTYLQEQLGVYTSGIGHFLQTYQSKKLWFVYPLFNPKRFDQFVNRCVIYSIPSYRFPELERTYRVEGSVLSIVSNSNKQYRDDADTQLMSHGNGFRMPNAGSFMKKPASVTDDGVNASRAQLNYEVISKDRKDGLNYAPIINKISSNPFTEYSKVIMRDVGRIDINWGYADPSLLYPGMPCKYRYLENEQIVELVGQIAFVHNYLHSNTQGLEDKVYINECMITLLVTKVPNNNLTKVSNPSYGKF